MSFLVLKHTKNAPTLAQVSLRRLDTNPMKKFLWQTMCIEFMYPFTLFKWQEKEWLVRGGSTNMHEGNSIMQSDNGKLRCFETAIFGVLGLHCNQF